MASLYRRGRIWYVSWHEEDGRRKYRSTGTKTKREAIQWLKEHDPSAEHQEPAWTDSELVELWLKELSDLGRSTVHMSHLRRALKVLGTDIEKAKVRLGEMSRTRSDQTVLLNYRAIRQWGRWCVLNGHKRIDPMASLKMPTRRTGRVYVRGVFTAEEAGLLSRHHLLYEISLATGLRLGELRDLGPENKRQVRGQCCLWLKPRGTKNRFEDILPISEDLWHRIQFPMWVPSKAWAAKYLRRDLVRLSIPIEDQDGHRRDWHSLRATFGNLLIQQGVLIPTVARLMRHSDGGALLLKRYLGNSGYATHVSAIIDK